MFWIRGGGKNTDQCSGQHEYQTCYVDERFPKRIKMKANTSICPNSNLTGPLTHSL
jgi:hypothetical protein